MTIHGEQDAQGVIVSTVLPITVSSIMSGNYNIRIAIDASRLGSPRLCVAGDLLGVRLPTCTRRLDVGQAAPVDNAVRTSVLGGRLLSLL